MTRMRLGEVQKALLRKLEHGPSACQGEWSSLRSLERHGLVTSTKYSPRRIVWALTDTGRLLVEDWQNQEAERRQRVADSNKRHKEAKEAFEKRNKEALEQILSWIAVERVNLSDYEWRDRVASLLESAQVGYDFDELLRVWRQDYV